MLSLSVTQRTKVHLCNTTLTTPEQGSHLLLNMLHGMVLLLRRHLIISGTTLIRKFGFRKARGLFVRHLLSTRREFDLEDTIDLVERQSRGLNVEEVDPRDPEGIDNCEDDIEPPANVLNACSLPSDFAEDGTSLIRTLTDRCDRND